MASSAPDAELAISIASTSSPASSESTAVIMEASLALEAEVEASTSPDRLSDDILRQVMEKRGTRNGRMLQEVLAASPYNIKVSYEVVRRRVKKLLDNENSIPKHTCLDNNTKRNEGDKQEERDHEAVARHLDMLADTVKSIVTDVVGEENTVRDGEEVETEAVDVHDHIAAVDDTEVETADSTSQTDKTSPDSESSAQVMYITDVVLPETGVVPQGAVQEVENAANAAIPLLNASDGCSDVLATGTDSTKRSAPGTGTSNPVPKRKKRAEYSVETRALCVHRHQIDGASYSTISKELAIPQDTVRAIVRKAKRTGSVVSAPRSGRPRKTSGIVDKVILEAVKSNNRCSAKVIQEELLRVYGVKLSSETVRRRVLEHTKQRIQAMSGGTSSETTPVSTQMDDMSPATNDVARKAPAPMQVDPTSMSLLDPVAFQQLLHVDGQLASDVEQGGSTSPPAEAVSAPLSLSTVPSPAPTNVNAAEVEQEIVPQEQSTIESQQPEETSIQKRHKRAEYSIETREQCVALHAQGQGYRRIGKTLNMPHTTVRAIVEKAQRTGSVLPAKRSGRPRVTDSIVDKVILQAVKTNEKCSARMIKEQLLAAYGVRVSCETIRRRVKDHSRQCMATAATTSPSEMLSNTAVDQQQIPSDQELLEVPSAPPTPTANIMTFDENGVHL